MWLAPVLQQLNRADASADRLNGPRRATSVESRGVRTCGGVASNLL